MPNFPFCQPMTTTESEMTRAIIFPSWEMRWNVTGRGLEDVIIKVNISRVRWRPGDHRGKRWGISDPQVTQLEQGDPW